MIEDLYEVYIESEVIATGMALEVATTLVDALFKKWYLVPELAIGVRRLKVKES